MARRAACEDGGWTRILTCSSAWFMNAVSLTKPQAPPACAGRRDRERVPATPLGRHRIGTTSPAANRRPAPVIRDEMDRIAVEIGERPDAIPRRDYEAANGSGPAAAHLDGLDKAPDCTTAL